MYFQNAVGVDSWLSVASGYAGDPAFMIPIPNTTEFHLGAGVSGSAYRFDWSNPQNHSAAVEVNLGSLSERHIVGD